MWVTAGDLVTGTALSCPRPGVSPLQDALAAANAAARAASLRQLGAWFPGYAFDEAAQDMDSRQFSILDLGDAVLRHLKHDEMMDRLLFDHDHRWGSDGMSFSHADAKGHRPPPEYVSPAGAETGFGRLDPGGLARALEERWTAIVNGADSHDAALSEVCGHLTRAYCSPVNTNIYISLRPVQRLRSPLGQPRRHHRSAPRSQALDHLRTGRTVGGEAVDRPRGHRPPVVARSDRARYGAGHPARVGPPGRRL